MLEEVLDFRNVQKAMKSVISNHGTGGIDGMQTDELRGIPRSELDIAETA